MCKSSYIIMQFLIQSRHSAECILPLFATEKVRIHSIFVAQRRLAREFLRLSADVCFMSNYNSNFIIFQLLRWHNYQHLNTYVCTIKNT